MNRKKFLQQAALTSGGIITAPVFAYSQGKNPGDPLPPEKVKNFVIAGHSNFDKVKSMLAEMPTLLYATWDWGNGDFETAWKVVAMLAIRK